MIDGPAHSRNGVTTRTVRQSTNVGHESRSGRTFRDTLRGLYRYRRRGAWFFVVSLSVVVIGIIAWPRKYTSEAKLLVRVGRSSVTLDPTVTTGHIIGVDTSREAEINSALEVINSRLILEKLIDKVGSEKPIETPLDREKAIIRLRDNLEIWSPKKTSVISLTYEARSPERAQAVADELVKLFLDEHLRVNSTPRSVQFFEAQAAAAKQQLDETTDELQRTKDDYALASIEGRRDTLERQIGVVEQQAIGTTIELSASQAKTAALRSELEGLPARVVRQFVNGLPADAANDMREELFRLQSTEEALRSRLTEVHPSLTAIRDQVRSVKDILAAEEPDRGQSMSAVLLTEHVVQRALTARSVAIDEQLGELGRQLKTLNAQEVQIVDLQREVDLLDTKYRTFVQNLEQARVDRELKNQEITNISVIQPPSLNVKATSPRKLLTAMIGFVLSFAGALALVFLSTRLDRSFVSAADVEESLAVPVLVTIPKSSREMSLFRVTR